MKTTARIMNKIWFIRLLSIMVFVAILFSSPVISYKPLFGLVAMSEECNNAKELQIMPETCFEKIHLNFDGINLHSINDYNELYDTWKSIQNISNIAGNVLIIEYVSNLYESDEYKLFIQERNRIKTIEEMHHFRCELNSFSKRYHKELVEKYVTETELPEYSELVHIEYTPFIILRLFNCFEPDVIYRLANNEKIVNIYLTDNTSLHAENDEYYDDKKSESSTYPSMSTVLSGIGATDIVSTGTYSGTGINIGIYEANATAATLPSHLQNMNLTYIEPTDQMTTHAIKVLSTVICLAPSANYYYQRVPNSINVGLENFLDYYCDIVNCSFAYNSSTTYSGIDAIYDYQVYAHYLILVVSAGNKKDTNGGYVTTPALAHNAISVGGVSYNSTNDYWYYETNTSCYIDNTGTDCYIKPTISAPFRVAIPNVGNTSGTSISAPLITGCIALFIEYEPLYSCSSDVITSLLNTTATRTHDYIQTYCYIDDRVGAGIIDLQLMFDCSNNLFQIISHNAQIQAGNVYTQQINVTAGDTINISIAWLTKATFNNGSASITSDNKYGLQLSYNQTTVAASTIYKNNIQTLRFTATTTGVYQITVYHLNTSSSSSGNDVLNLTWDF